MIVHQFVRTWSPEAGRDDQCARMASVVSQPVCSRLKAQDMPERTDGTGAERELCGRATRSEGLAGRADSLCPASARSAAAATRRRSASA